MSRPAGRAQDQPKGNTLTVCFLGEEHLLGEADDLRFGRSGDLLVDDNPFMHRLVGRFVHREGVWWLQNIGTKIRLELQDVDAGTVLEAAPGQQVPVVATSFVVRFTAGPTSYELDGQRSGGGILPDEHGEITGTATIEFGAVPLSPEQHLLIVALYESRLRLGWFESNVTIADRLGWTTNKFNRKLDVVCDKLSRAGVPGLKGKSGGLVEGRRETLLNHALQAGLVGPHDLDLLRVFTDS